ncbi:hypothetical protein PAPPERLAPAPP_00130 [Brevundimonas phage vB_BpoS-Papperlapapp]|uniref:Uncharacterized protein n=1 Tax=Brevundimonas phage vB_BpoS-Domovoi TaxID=2948598 RepID=A0A9E7MRB9_9CAUD|nr:hypothetical protein DOMOVOI_04910 [Brevundimonas phage vB_BpoS-Domovoi]USN15767.1 hypothetical protein PAPPERLAPAPP_00130 [Brevundimonas phage vB_BpoS-Papperlapapp]
MDRAAIDEMFADGRLVNVKFATSGAAVTADDLVAELLSADRQIAAGTAIRVDDIDNYSPASA